MQIGHTKLGSYFSYKERRVSCGLGLIYPGSSVAIATNNTEVKNIINECISYFQKGQWGRTNRNTNKFPKA